MLAMPALCWLCRMPLRIARHLQLMSARITAVTAALSTLRIAGRFSKGRLRPLPA